MGKSLSGRDDDYIADEVSQYVYEVFEGVFKQNSNFDPDSPDAYVLNGNNIEQILSHNGIEPAMYVMYMLNMEKKYHYLPTSRILEVDTERFFDVLILAMRMTKALNNIRMYNAESQYKLIASKDIIMLRKIPQYLDEHTTLNMSIPMIRNPFVRKEKLDTATVEIYSTNAKKFGLFLTVEKEKRGSVGFGFGKYIFEEELDEFGEPSGLPRCIMIFSKNFCEKNNIKSMVKCRLDDENFEVTDFISIRDDSGIGADLLCSIMDWCGDHQHKVSYIDNLTATLNDMRLGPRYLSVYMDKYAHSKVQQEAFMDSWIKYYHNDDVTSSLANFMVLDLYLKTYINFAIKTGETYYFHIMKFDLAPDNGSYEENWDILGITKTKEIESEEHWKVSETFTIKEIRVAATNAYSNSHINVNLPTMMLRLQLSDDTIKALYINKAKKFSYKFEASREYDMIPYYIDEIYIN